MADIKLNCRWHHWRINSTFKEEMGNPYSHTLATQNRIWKRFHYMLRNPYRILIIPTILYSHYGNQELYQIHGVIPCHLLVQKPFCIFPLLLAESPLPQKINPTRLDLYLLSQSPHRNFIPHHTNTEALQNITNSFLPLGLWILFIYFFLARNLLPQILRELVPSHSSSVNLK